MQVQICSCSHLRNFWLKKGGDYIVRGVSSTAVDERDFLDCNLDLGG